MDFDFGRDCGYCPQPARYALAVSLAGDDRRPLGSQPVLVCQSHYDAMFRAIA